MAGRGTDFWAVYLAGRRLRDARETKPSTTGHTVS
jgi:hypothetical protein